MAIWSRQLVATCLDPAVIQISHASIYVYLHGLKTQPPTSLFMYLLIGIYLFLQTAVINMEAKTVPNKWKCCMIA